MNISHITPDSNVSRDRFVVMDSDHHDAVVCSDREAVSAAIDMLNHPVTVLRITLDELCRDVTEEFVMPVPDPREDRWSRADRRHQEMMEQV
jgi:hypothetical protein